MRNSKPLTSGKLQRYVTICLCLVFLLALLPACQPTPTVHFNRLERLIFGTPADQLQAELTRHQADYRTNLIRFQPSDPSYIAWLQGYVADPTVRDIYRITDSLLGDLSDEERQLSRALGRAYRLCPDMPRLQHFYTMVTADYDNYDHRVYTDGTDLCLATDVYALPAMQRYAFFGLPAHVVRLCVPQQMVPDCMRQLAMQHIAWPDHGATLLDYAVAEGKVLYFVEKTMPHLHDTLLLRYSAPQLEWMRKNEKNVWGWLIQNQLLYNNDLSQFHNLLDYAPKTNAFGEGSAPRTVAYIGWQIVKSYARRTNCTMQQLFDEVDSRRILSQSAWRP